MKDFFNLKIVVSKNAKSKMFRGCSIILEVWNIWRPPEAVFESFLDYKAKVWAIKMQNQKCIKNVK